MPSASSPQNILLLIPNFGFGGAQQVFHDHSVELAKQFQVTECVFNLDQADAYPSGNPVINLDVPGHGSTLDKIKHFVQRCTRLRFHKKRLNTQVCISHLEGADYVNLLSRTGERTILCIHGSKVHDGEIQGWVGWFRQKVFMPFFYRQPDHIVTVSRDIRQELIDHYKLDPTRITTINNFFHPEKILGRAAEPIDPQYEPLFSQPDVLITSGRLARQKNQAPLLDVFAEVLKSRPTTKLVLLGDGELRNELVAQARELGLRFYQAWNNDPLDQEYSLYFLGYQQNPFRYIRRAAMFVFPSGWEGFPMALGEAMICGLPVVSTDCPTGPREMLAPTTPYGQKISEAEPAEYGMLMPLLGSDYRTYTRGVWVRTLLELLADSARRAHYAAKAQERMQDFTRDRIFQKWEQVIRGQ
ncbi:glycosyltransferase [Hymenobacter lutimineralis]|uniref:Glycosyltransferase n=1 Tax=Hymenobacter lutimineralis TaxID=2606448 RepID=A0A5D6VAI2_9BACT|nr:glycosyltransferase [Hymenobacter lutimineralis]TYZ11918.1 glycosyltransferase [Hymenobacter lutimineralis]